MNFFASFAAIVALSASAGFAADLTIATGKSGGGYDKAAQGWATRLGQGSTAYTTEVLNLNGSKEIVAALCGDRAQLGLAQADALFLASQQGCQLEAVGVYGDEVAVLLFPPKSDYDELEDLTENDAVAVDTIGSGTELFWDTIVKIEKDSRKPQPWASAQKVTQPVAMANASGTSGKIKAQVLVRKKNSPDIMNLLELGWTVGYFWDKNIDDQQFNGGALYESYKETFPASKKHKNYVYKVNSFYVAAPSVVQDQNKLTVVSTAAGN